MTGNMSHISFLFSINEKEFGKIRFYFSFDQDGLKGIQCLSDVILILVKFRRIKRFLGKSDTSV